MTVGRITNQMVTAQVLANVNRAQSAMADTEQQLSSGKRINDPSDDPYGASLAVSLNGQLARLSDYASNVTDGTGWVSAGLSAMGSITQEVQRAQELVTGALNGTQNAAGLQSVGAELNQLIDAIKSDANAQYGGQYVFAGADTGTQPYSTADDTYAGDTGSVQRVIGPGTSVGVNAQLSSVLSGGGSDPGLIAKLRTIANALNSGTKPASSSLSGLTDSLNSLTQQQATLGAVQSRMTLASSRISSLQTSTKAALSDDQDADYAATVTAFSNEQAAFSAALKAGASIVQASLMDFLNS